MNIAKITPYQILDSRGEPTLMVTMTSDSGKTANFSVPAGSSKGQDEAVEKRDGGDKYGGNGVQGCIDVITNVVGPKFIGYPLDQQDDFDGLLIALDGSEHKENLGGNTLLALSGAYLRLSATEKDQPLWQYIAETNQTSPEFPRLFANMVGGGKHAPGLSIQEYLIIPDISSPAEAIETIYNVYHTLQSIMQNLYGPSASLVGQEGGLAPIGTSTEVILEALSQLNTKLTTKIDIALDVAANSFYKDGLYSLEAQSLHASDLLKLYEDWNTKFGLFALEDPFAENDIEGIEILKTMDKQNKPFMIIGDDYTVTSKTKIETLQKDELFDGIIIKPNQVGTMTETFEAIKAARASKAKVIVSHRSGETNDDFVVDLAYGIGAMGLKLGAPARGERIAKYNRLLQIQADLEANQADAAANAKPVSGPTTTQKEPAGSSRPTPKLTLDTTPPKTPTPPPAPAPTPPTPPATNPQTFTPPAPNAAVATMPGSPLSTPPPPAPIPTPTTPPAPNPGPPITPPAPAT